MLVEKRGIAGMLRNRAARILAPLLVGLVTIVPLSLFVDSWALECDALHPREAIFAAIIAGDAEQVGRLLDQGVDIEKADGRLQTRPLDSSGTCGETG